MSSSSNISEKSPLDAAQKIVTELTGMKSEHQSLALRFAMETLGIHLSGVTHAAATVIAAPTAPPRAETHSPSNIEHSTDIRSFTEMKAPKSDRQFSAVVAYFYQFEARPEERKDTINGDTMKEAARLAGWPQVTRWNMTLTNAKNAGYLDAVGDGYFKLSSVGENLVAITLPGNGTPRASIPASKVSKRKAPKKVAKKR